MEKMKQKMKIGEKSCELCGLKATCICFKCVMYFCDSCFKIIHNMKISNQHKKENLDLFVPMDIKCHKHPKDRINLFCLDENGNIYLYLTLFFIFI